MKNFLMFPFVCVFICLFLTACERDDVSPATEYDFVAMHLPEASNDDPYLSLVRIRDGEPQFTHLTDQFPYRYEQWKRSIHQSDGVLGFTLHESLTDGVWTGVWMDMRDGKVHELPKLDACVDFGYEPGCDRQSFTQRNSVRIGESGHVFYVAMSEYKAGGWHDEPRYRLVRLDPQSGEYLVAPLISNWTLSQPEIDPDRYGLARISDNIFPSSCGRYVYGRTIGWGISGGSLIGSRGIMFRYDFRDEAFSRVNNVGYGFNPYYITADNNYLVFRNEETRQNKRMNMGNGQVVVLEEGVAGDHIHQTGINNYGTVGAAYPLREIWYGSIVHDETTRIRVPDHPTAIVFSTDGDYLYFRNRFGDENYLLRTSDLTEDASVDTVAILPGNVRIMSILNSQ